MILIFKAACGFSSTADFGGRQPKTRMKQRENGWSNPHAWSQSCAIDWLFSNLWSNSLCLTRSSRGYSEMFTGRTVSLWPAFAHLNKSRNVLGWILCFWSKKNVNRNLSLLHRHFCHSFHALDLILANCLATVGTHSSRVVTRVLPYDVFHIFQHISFSAPERMREKPQNGLG